MPPIPPPATRRPLLVASNVVDKAGGVVGLDRPGRAIDDARRITDPSSGYRAARADLLERLVLEQDQFWTSEILIEALRHRARERSAPGQCASRVRSGDSEAALGRVLADRFPFPLDGAPVERAHHDLHEIRVVLPDRGAIGHHQLLGRLLPGRRGKGDDGSILLAATSGAMLILTRNPSSRQWYPMQQQGNRLSNLRNGDCRSVFFFPAAFLA